MSSANLAEPTLIIDRDALAQANEAPAYVHEETTTVDWMIDPDGLGLPPRSVELEVYARIWAFTRNGVGVYCEPQQKLAERIYTTRKSVNIALQSLIERNLITVVGIVGDEKTGIRAYVVNAAPASQAKRRLEERWDREQGETVAIETPAPRMKVVMGAAQEAPHAPEQHESADASEDAAPSPEGFDELMRAYPKETSKRYAAKARELYQGLLDEGHTPEEIKEALDAYLDDHRLANAGRINKRFLKSFNNFLSEGSGARAYMAPSRRKRAAASEKKPLKPCFSRAHSGDKSFWVVSYGPNAFELDLPADAGEEQLNEAFEREVAARGLAKKTG